MADAERKKRFVNELIESNSPCWVKIKPEELAELVNKGMSKTVDTSGVKQFLFGAFGVEIQHKMREGMKSVLNRFGIKDAKDLEAALAKLQR